jgi:hypothetical protein
MTLSTYLDLTAAVLRRVSRHDIPRARETVSRLALINGAPHPAMVGKSGDATKQVHVYAGSKLTGDITMPRLIAAAVLAIMLAACTENPTDPGTGKSAAQPASFSVAVPGTTASITSYSCSLKSSTTGEVRCSYDIANPDQQLLNLYPQAALKIDYKCVNANTGKIQSSGTGVRWPGLSIEGVTASNPTATDVQLSTVTLSNSYTHSDTKLNACKGKQTLVITSYSMSYWELYVDNWYGGQPNTDYHSICVASDHRFGCATL